MPVRLIWGAAQGMSCFRCIKAYLTPVHMKEQHAESTKKNLHRIVGSNTIKISPLDIILANQVKTSQSQGDA